VIPFVLLSLPIFGMVALGWVAVRTRVVKPDAPSAFSVRFGLPSLVLLLIAGQPIWPPVPGDDVGSFDQLRSPSAPYQSGPRLSLSG
jgi:hypothetical protein